MTANGYKVQIVDVQNLSAIKAQHQVPPMLQSCHTAIVDGYVIEGHVSVEEINRLLAERPDILGLAVPGMPTGSPGMEDSLGTLQAYDVIAFDAAGNTTVYASYGY